MMCWITMLVIACHVHWGAAVLNNRDNQVYTAGCGFDVVPGQPSMFKFCNAYGQCIKSACGMSRVFSKTDCGCVPLLNTINEGNSSTASVKLTLPDNSTRPEERSAARASVVSSFLEPNDRTINSVTSKSKTAAAASSNSSSTRTIKFPMTIAIETGSQSKNVTQPPSDVESSTIGFTIQPTLFSTASKHLNMTRVLPLNHTFVCRTEVNISGMNDRELLTGDTTVGTVYVGVRGLNNNNGSIQFSGSGLLWIPYYDSISFPSGLTISMEVQENVTHMVAQGLVNNCGNGVSPSYSIVLDPSQKLVRFKAVVISETRPQPTLENLEISVPYEPGFSKIIEMECDGNNLIGRVSGHMAGTHISSKDSHTQVYKEPWDTIAHKHGNQMKTFSCKHCVLLQTPKHPTNVDAQTLTSWVTTMRQLAASTVKLKVTE
ncbi:uncharacterized protein LOC106067524 isoform X3 [Biomphalaria glabrata]|uniref:Uncharacterized protein LOC106067524 isoform X3 n=1 Tax=Biomphalaria glabrata TaxID=6526 RepID=A0A9W2YHW4_BIOGL|nr:uncharacterized protein LOC106067524 isoform X3 [Biomphalaria glabrata]